MAIIGISVGFCFICFLILAFNIIRAPRGYEDESGFHFEDPVKENLPPQNSRIEHAHQTYITKSPVS